MPYQRKANAAAVYASKNNFPVALWKIFPIIKPHLSHPVINIHPCFMPFLCG
jgi:hypothetical protein